MVDKKGTPPKGDYVDLLDSLEKALRDVGFIGTHKALRLVKKLREVLS